MTINAIPTLRSPRIQRLRSIINGMSPPFGDTQVRIRSAYL
jgi:hypothetical protein